jgi:hypothetical protein
LDFEKLKSQLLFYCASSDIYQGAKRMPLEHIDLESMFKEIDAIRRKYNVPKGMGFVPDKLEIVLERKEIGKFDLTYSEFFDYLPSHFRSIAIEGAIQFMQQVGFPVEKIVRMEKGVKVQISGNFQVATFPMVEILLQNKGHESEIRLKLDEIGKAYQIFSDLLYFNWDWNDDTKSKFNELCATLDRIMQEHPSVTEEIEAVIRKYKLKKT